MKSQNLNKNNRSQKTSPLQQQLLPEKKKTLFKNKKLSKFFN